MQFNLSRCLIKILQIVKADYEEILFLDLSLESRGRGKTHAHATSTTSVYANNIACFTISLVNSACKILLTKFHLI